MLHPAIDPTLLPPFLELIFAKDAPLRPDWTGEMGDTAQNSTLTPEELESAKSLHAAMFEWNLSKRPADPASRAEWADLLREDRAVIFEQIPDGSERREALAKLRAIYYETKSHLLEAEAPLRVLIEKMGRNFENWKALRDAEPEGGIQ